MEERLEERLNSEYKDLRKKVKGWWFCLHARQILLVNVMAANDTLQSTCLMLCYVEQVI